MNDKEFYDDVISLRNLYAEKYGMTDLEIGWRGDGVREDVRYYGDPKESDTEVYLRMNFGNYLKKVVDWSGYPKDFLDTPEFERGMSNGSVFKLSFDRQEVSDLDRCEEAFDRKIVDLYTACKDGVDREYKNWDPEYCTLYDGTRVPKERMDAIREVSEEDDIFRNVPGYLDDVLLDEDGYYDIHDFVRAEPDQYISLLLGSSNPGKSPAFNTAVAALYMARPQTNVEEFSWPSDREILAVWDEAEKRLEEGRPIPVRIGADACNIFEAYPFKSGKSVEDIYRYSIDGEKEDWKLFHDAHNSCFYALPLELADSGLRQIDGISHLYDGENPAAFTTEIAGGIASAVNSPEIAERAANYIADHIDDCAYNIDEVKAAMAVWMCKPDDVYPEETGDPCRFSNEEDASFSKFLENCDHERVSEAVRLSENVQFWSSGQKDMNHYWEENFEAGPFECGNSADFAYFHYAKNDSPAPAMRDISGSAESSYVNGVTSIVTENGLEEGVAIMEGSYENLLKAKDFSWGLKEAEDVDAKRMDQSVSENMCQETETGFSGPRL